MTTVLRRGTDFMKKAAYLAVSATLSVSSLVVLAPTKAFAEGETWTGGATLSLNPGGTANITDVDLVGNPSDHTSVKITARYGSIALDTPDSGLVQDMNSSQLIIMSGTVASINATLDAGVIYTAYADRADAVEFTVGNNYAFNETNGHVYEFSSSLFDEGVDAVASAAARTYDGVTGYLATITTTDEHAIVADLASQYGNAWISGSDTALEGDWKYTSGPESGQSFWSGNDSGSAVGGFYENWGGGEPNNDSNEDCINIMNDGSWNDSTCTGYEPGIVIEYGSVGDLPAYTEGAVLSVPVSITSTEVDITTCTELMELDDTTPIGYDFWTINIMNDIDCSGVANFEPLYAFDNFSGTFNGNDFTISNLTIDNGNPTETGLFAVTDYATMRDITLTNATVIGDYNKTGVLVGYAHDTNMDNITVDGTVTNTDTNSYGTGIIAGVFDSDRENLVSTARGIHATGTVAGYGDVGGVFGGSWSYNASRIEMSDLTADVDVSLDTTSGEDWGMGGLIGELYVGDYSSQSLMSCWSTGTVSGSDSVGGLIGNIGTESSNSTVDNHLVLEDCYARGNVEATGYASGGLIGATWTGPTTRALIQRTYATGNATNTNDTAVGSFIGSLASIDDSLSDYSVINSFATGTATGSDSTAGGMIGEYQVSDPVTVSGLYYVVNENSPEVEGCSSIVTTGCIAVPSADYFKSNIANAPLNTWDFEDVWGANVNDFPTLGGGDLPATTNLPSGTEENAAPNSGDANGDGQQDSTQANVASMVNDVTGNYAVLEVSSSCMITSINVATEATNNTADSGYNYNYGMMNFVLACDTVGATAQVRQIYYDPSGSFTVRKYNPNTHAYTTITDASIGSTAYGGTSALSTTYNVTDGGALDTDGVANNTIIDPAGLAAGIVSAPNTGLGPLR